MLTDYIDLLRKSLQRVQTENPYNTLAIVVLPGHIHTIWQLPSADQNYSLRWRKIKSYFTASLRKLAIPVITNARGEFNIWQNRFWEHTIRDDNDFENHVNYIHYNPVKHVHVKRVRDWPYSSFNRYVKEDVLEVDWGESYKSDSGDFGEVK